MSYIDTDRAAAVAAAEQVELDKAFARAVGERARRDARDVVKMLSRTFKADSETCYQAWLRGEDARAVLVAGGPRGEPVWRLGDPPAGVQPLEEHSFLELVEQGIARKAQSRSYFTARSGRSVELGSDDARLHARDIKMAKEHVATIEQWVVTEAVPREMQQRLSKVAMEPALRQQVVKAIASNDKSVLDEILIRRMIVPGPDGRNREYLEGRRWHPTEWPRIAEDQRPAGVSQYTISELAGRVLITETARARWGDEVLEGADIAHWRA